MLLGVSATYASADEAVVRAGLPDRMPDDGIMASKVALQQMHAWTHHAFALDPLAGEPRPVSVSVIRQDHSVLRFRESCIDTPIVIGDRSFEHGLGTHANSEIEVVIPAGAKAFNAWAGIDNNNDTQGMRGSAVFSVEIDGTEAARTTVLRGGERPFPVNVPLPPGVGKLVLKVDATADGASHDQADWADAHFVMQDDNIVWLDADQPDLVLGDAQPPLSFLFGGKPSAELFPAWDRTTERTEDADRVVDTVTWTDPGSGLRVTAVIATYNRYPAVDWVAWIENTGTQDTPLLEDIQALDVMLRTGYMRTPVRIHELEGDACGETSFLPKTAVLEPGKEHRLTPTGGRPSSISAFPFFNVQYGNRGAIVAVGWTGQWCARFDRAANGPTRLRAGLESTRLVLRAGERIRTPRVVLLTWEGERMAAHNRWRRLLIDHYVPRLDAMPLRLPIALQTFDRYNARPGWATEAGQIAAVETAHALGCDTYWLDAAWFPGNFPNGVGNWFCKPDAFPNGLAPVSRAARAHGMRFVLWFEPERVAAGSRIAEEHPEFVFGGKDGGLFKLHDPNARRFLTELLSQRIDEYGIDVYRNDFNMDPLESWRANDAPDRQGMTEIQYVMGLYAMWDELRERHPGLWIDNCSSGGRRIDIEMCSRSVPLWRSDTNCSPGHREWNQAQTMEISLYVPLHTACAWTPDVYEVRSASTGGLLCQFDYQAPDFPFEQAKTCIAETRTNQPFWYGDFYPLTAGGTAPDQFVAYQLHRPDLNAGVVYAFRRPECDLAGLILGLRGIETDATYLTEFSDGAGKSTTAETPGEELASGSALRVPGKGGSMVLRYQRR